MSSRDTGILQALTDAYAGVPSVLEARGWALLGFAAIGFAALLLLERHSTKFSLRRGLAYVFPIGLYRTGTTRADILNAILSISFWQPLITLAAGIFAGLNIHEALDSEFGQRPELIETKWVVILVQFTLLLLWTEFFAYVIHYMKHKIPWLWSFHRVHHSGESLIVSTAFRDHPIDTLLTAILQPVGVGTASGLGLYLLGAPLLPESTVVIAGFYFWYGTLLNVLHHSHLWISFGPLNYFIAAPIMHQIHHSAELRHRDRNLGGFMTIFDWLFGTIYCPKGHEEYRWGLNDEEYGQNNPHRRLRDFYIEPMVHAWRTIRPRATNRAASVAAGSNRTPQ